MPDSSIKDEGLYEATISNAAAAKSRSSEARKSGRSGSYEGWTVSALKKRAKELGISGYSDKKKDQLVSLLRKY